MSDDLIHTLRDFIIAEGKVARAQIQDMWKQPLKERIAEGEAIDNIEVAEVNFGYALLRCENNISRFRQGDLLKLHKDGYGRKQVFPCQLYEDRDSELIIKPDFRCNFTSLSAGKGWILDRNFFNTSKMSLNMLNTISYNSHKVSSITSIIQGRSKPSIDSKKKSRALKKAEKLRLDPTQSDAFACAFASSNYYVIQGPPGTGKTWVLAYLAKEMAEAGEKVLITAFTHRAINNALNKIVQTTGYGNVIKVGKDEYADDLILVNNHPSFPVSLYTENQGMIIGATCYALNRILSDAPFDSVIIDEAAQVPLHLAIFAMSVGKRTIFIGDHKQMQPIIVGKHSDDRVTRSVFELIFQHTPGVMLETTYRMNSEINEFPSQYFYDSRLKPDKKVSKNRLELKKEPKKYPEILDKNIPSVFVEIGHQNMGMRSPQEAEIAAGVAAEAISCGVPADEIAIVAPFRAQVRLIRKRLFQLLASEADRALSNIVVDTIERIQGQERDLIIISLTTSNPEYAVKRREFFFKPNRLNVALTRARVKRIVIGSPYLFTSEKLSKRNISGLELYPALWKQSHKVVIEPESLSTELE